MSGRRKTGIVLLVLLIGMVTLFGRCFFANDYRVRSFRMRWLGHTPTVKPIIISLAPTAPPPTISPWSVATVDESMRVFEDIYARANPSVVNIKVVSRATPEFEMDLSETATPDPAREYLIIGNGSGFVYDQRGHIATNYHVVEGAEDIQVVFSDGESFPAKVIGVDKECDLAVVKVYCDPDRLKPLPVGNSEALRVGQRVVAIGSPFDMEGTMTTGIVSALGRLLPSDGAGIGSRKYAIPDMIQTDAAINPGNSGGPLLNLLGEVVGINTAIQSPVAGSSGVGLAIPSNLIAQVIPALVARGEYEHPWIGVSTAALHSSLNEALGLPQDMKGLLVQEVATNGPAQAAGMVVGLSHVSVGDKQFRQGSDIILTVDDRPVSTPNDLLSYLACETEVGQTIRLGVLRDGQTIEVTVDIAAHPPSAD